MSSASSSRAASISARTDELRTLLRRHLPAIHQVLYQYGASNPRIFGSVARGDATHDSDVDLYVDIADSGAEALWSLSGLSEDLRELLGVRVDVVSGSVLRDRVAASAESDLIPLE